MPLSGRGALAGAAPDLHTRAGRGAGAGGREKGACKTTLVKLLARLYDPVEGRVLLDGRDLRGYDLDALRAAIGVIFQDFVRHNLPAADNIAVGCIEARGDRRRIEAAASAALADDVVAKLPDGYDQMIGKRFQDNVDLSGGEWQKMAIARAYMRDAEVLILDEPTAALDARSEYEVFQCVRELSAGRSAVLISHRFSSVRMATASWCSPTAGWRRRARTPPCLRRAAATPSCSSFRPPATARRRARSDRTASRALARHGSGCSR